MIWKDVIYYDEGELKEDYVGLYQISENGLIKSLSRPRWNGKAWYFTKEKIRKFNKTKDGYFCVRLAKNKKQKSFLVHRLVAFAFLDYFSNKPEINHINAIKTDNHVENLEWCTHRENVEHRDKNNLKKIIKGEECPQSKLTHDNVVDILRKLKNTNMTHKEIAKEYGVGRATISHINNRTTWRHVQLEEK